MASGAERFALGRANVFSLTFPPGETPEVTIRCDTRGCGATETTHVQPQMPPSVVAKRFRRRGWEVDDEGRTASCPAHAFGSRGRKKPKSTAVDEIAIAIPQEPRVDPPAQDDHPLSAAGDGSIPIEPKEPTMEAHPPAPAPSIDARKANFAAARLLDEHYIAERRCYAEGWSDATIAEMTGASESHVAETREAVYGPMGDPEMDDLQAQIAAVSTHYRQEIEGLRELIAKTEQSFRERFARLQTQITELKKKRSAWSPGPGAVTRSSP